MRRHRQIGLLSALAGVALVLAACSSSSKTSTGSTSTSPTTAAASSPSSSAPSTAAATLMATANAKFGQILVASNGKSLYVFDPDAGGQIACTGSCAATWPPLVVSSGTPTGTGVTAALATVARPDGGQQVTLAGRPLYTFSGDPTAGTVNGDGIGGVWHVAKPAGVPTAASSRPGY